MAAPIEFYFDFASPYGYLASEKIDALAAKHGRTVDWKPMLLGPSFKASGMAPLVDIPLKGEYSKRDFDRSARYHGVAFRMPGVFPIGTVAAARAFLWAQDRDPVKAKAFAHALFRAYFAAGVDISGAEAVLDVAAKAGLDPAAMRAGIGEQAIKDRLKASVEDAIARGVFGSPYVFVDGEPFWGMDRLDQIDRWLQTGGF
jgi:2-hydroxychromene-2-carboxylate isomerase